MRRWQNKSVEDFKSGSKLFYLRAVSMDGWMELAWISVKTNIGEGIPDLNKNFCFFNFLLNISCNGTI